MANAATSQQVFELKVILRNSNPPIWRRLQVPGDSTLGDLHRVIQIAMGWEDSHLHEFDLAGKTFSTPRDGSANRNESAFKLNALLKRAGMRLQYLYDFGDNWLHDIVVERIFPVEADAQYPRCVAGERAGPPEDCGGVWGYDELLEALRDPTHEDHEDFKELVGSDFDPEAFSLEAVNKRLLRQA